VKNNTLKTARNIPELNIMMVGGQYYKYEPYKQLHNIKRMAKHSFCSELIAKNNNLRRKTLSVSSVKKLNNKIYSYIMRPNFYLLTSINNKLS